VLQTDGPKVPKFVLPSAEEKEEKKEADRFAQTYAGKLIFIEPYVDSKS
jgi:hypothetical protein